MEALSRRIQGYIVQGYPRCRSRYKHLQQIQPGFEIDLLLYPQKGEAYHSWNLFVFFLMRFASSWIIFGRYLSPFPGCALGLARRKFTDKRFFMINPCYWNLCTIHFSKNTSRTVFNLKLKFQNVNYATFKPLSTSGNLQSGARHKQSGLG